MTASGQRSAAVIALLLSAAVHVGLGYFVGRIQLLGADVVRSGSLVGAPVMLVPWAEPPAPDVPERVETVREPEADPPKESDQLRLGIARSPHETENWIGFAEPTPHSAPLSEVDQPALDPNAGAPGTAGGIAAAAGERAHESGVPAPTSVAAQSAESGAPVGAAGEAGPQGSAEAGGRTREQAGAPGEVEQGPDDPSRPLIVERVEAAARTIDERVAGFVGPPAALANPMAGESPGAPADDARAGPAGAPEGGPGNSGAVPGERSERESNASSRELAIEVRPGRVAAAEGLEIITRRPEFSRVTRLMAAPARNPRLRVTFDRQGLVRHAEFIEATGIRDVDDPVQHAVYRWTARGRALAELPASDPRAGVTITVTILLR